MIVEGRKQTMGPSSSSLASKARVKEIIEQIIDKEKPHRPAMSSDSSIVMNKEEERVVAGMKRK